MPAIDPEQLAAFRASIRSKIARDRVREGAESRALKERVLPRLRAAIEQARTGGLCARVWLFGSYAWGEPGERSDIDLLVEGCSDPDRLGGLVARACRRDVQAIEIERAPESLRARVLAEGTLL